MRHVLFAISALLLAACGAPEDAPTVSAAASAKAVVGPLLLDYQGGDEDRAAAWEAVAEWVELCGADVRLDPSGLPLVASDAGLPDDRGGVTWNDGQRPTGIQFRTSADGYDVRAILAHEIGHALGVEHAPDGVAALMSAEDTGVRHVTLADCRALAMGRWD